MIATVGRVTSELQFIPARGRKLLTIDHAHLCKSCNSSPRGDGNRSMWRSYLSEASVAIHPREGTETYTNHICLR